MAEYFYDKWTDFIECWVTPVTRTLQEKMYQAYVTICFVVKIIHLHYLHLKQIYIARTLHCALCQLFIEYREELFQGVLSASTILTPALEQQHNSIVEAKVKRFIKKLKLPILSQKYKEQISCALNVYFYHVKRMAAEANKSSQDFQFGQVVVQLVAGDIVKQECDVIVNSVDSSYNLNLGKISASIYKHVDKQVQQECHQNRIDGCDYFRLTSAGSLPCKWILHFVVPDDLQEMSDSFLQLLQYADSDALQAKTIAVPCLGMGNQRKKLESVILFFRDSIQCFTCFGSVKCIQYIKIIIQSKSYQEFCSCFQHSLTSSPVENGLQLKRGTVFNNVQKWNQCQFCEYVAHKLQLTEIEEYKLQKIACKTRTNISKDGPKRIKIEGLKKDFVLRAVPKVTKLLTKLKAAYTVSNHVQWLYWTSYKLIPYNTASSYKIEMAYLDAKNKETYDANTLVVFANRWRHQINFERMKYFTIDSKHTGKLLRRTNDLPKTWDLTGKPKYLNFVNPQSEEFKAIENRLATAVPTISDIKIERVQNESLYRLYSVKKQEVLLHLQSDRVAEMDLYHGSPNYETIAGTYFNRGYAGATGTLYGKGTYFATELQTAMKHCDRQDGYYTVILATVLTGNYTKGYGNMRDAGVNKDGVLYDSSVDNESNPKFFVVYHDASAYPKYVVTFTTKK
uniref:poly [ADP-ribose] polymerase 14-like n=1 Tax=Ciona intestinalis TaxID=7719 RepID=UPI000EF5005F|nr:poly [ADP-ribose] polymerase 14-like [Ciona intestinalis]XP_026690021.1 poly [ADP-ribose] polymerase 14-like [Ciona intestinalis]|eukprot:XP_026690020.1 poly [ADP-ribose] polymerase 14-like [Ciona intestinalis]